MGEPALVAQPLDIHLLDKPLTGEPQEVDSADERLDKVNGLVSRSAYAEAGQEAEEQLRGGLLDVRLVGPYLFGLFLEGGLESLPVIFLSLSKLLMSNWQVFGPRERKDVFADGGLRWLFKVVNKHIEHHERLKNETWQRWSAASNREPMEQALTLSEEIFASFSRVMPRNGCEAPFRRLTQWMEGHLRTLPSPAPEAAAAAEPAPRAAAESVASPGEARLPVAEVPRAPAGPVLPVSPALATLMRRLAAFDTLMARQDYRRASVVATDLLNVVEHFDPRVYLPSLFSRLYSGLSKHSEEVEQQMQQGTESLSFRAMDQLYRVDLDAFLAQDEGAEREGE